MERCGFSGPGCVRKDWVREGSTPLPTNESWATLLVPAVTLRTLLIACIAAIAAIGLPGIAQAAPASSLTTVRSHEVSVRGGRSLAAVSPRVSFDLVGVHWQGRGSLDVRVRAVGGRWGPWLAVDGDDGPDPGTAEGRTRGSWRVGEGLWVGPSTRFEVRTRGDVRRARVWTVKSRISRVPMRSPSATTRPAIVTRGQWQADESIRRADPELAGSLRLALVHHTAGPNVYTREQAPAVVRAIMAYHVQSNGWNDIGYNALVDRFGTVYEGRYGGVDQNVVGAHAKGFNTGSFGIAVLGEFTSVEPSAASVDALARTLAWRLDLAHVDPRSSLQAVSAGNERFQPGIPVSLRVISGHRDTGLTACPGNRLYARLPALAERVAAIGLPKIYDPELTGVWGGAMSLTARLSSPLPWTVLVSGADGLPVANVSGTGSDVSAGWETAGLAPGGYSWSIDVPGAIPAVGTLDTAASAPSLAFEGASADPEVISPDGDGTLDSAAITYRITAPATVSAVALDDLGAGVATLELPRWRRAGEHVIPFDGLGLADGAYTIRLDARGTGGQVATTTVGVAISHTLGQVTLSSAVFTPNGDGRTDRLVIRFRLTAPAAVRIRMLRFGRWAATPFSAALEPGDHFLEWDGTKAGRTVRDGDYAAVVEATDALATARVTIPFLTDGTPPQVRVVSAAPPRLWVSEPARLRIVVNGLWRRLDVAARGTVRLPWVSRIRTLLVVAHDSAGNVGELRR